MDMQAVQTTPQNLAAPKQLQTCTARTPKRLLDVAIACTGLLMFGPVILFCVFWVWLLDGGPVIYRQWRVGEQGWLFRLYKLRTMRRDAERQTGATMATANDTRIIPGCQWMRRSHVDELPQLLNILMGDMSVVGPRPERPEIIEQLRSSIPLIEQRLCGKPGLTGLAQVCNGYTNDVQGAQRKLHYDLEYLKRPSLMGDLKVILKTIPKFWDHAAC